MATKSNTDGAWPAVGFVGYKHMRAALADCSRNHIANLVAEGLLPPAVPIDRVRVGWPVDQARQALEALPALIAERRVRPVAIRAGVAERPASPRSMAPGAEATTADQAASQPIRRRGRPAKVAA